MSTNLDTVVAIPIVAFANDGTIDQEATSAVIARMVDSGVKVLTANGNTGEYYSLSRDERRTTLRLCAQFTEQAEVVAGIGHDLESAKRDGKFAVEHGCNHLMVHHPPHPFVSPQGWLHYNKSIADTFRDVNIVPYVKSCNIPNETILELIEEVPNVGAVKYAVDDPNRYSALVADAPREVEWICGVAEWWAPSFWSATDRPAFTSGLANVSPTLSLDLYRALRSADQRAIARLWNLVRPFEELRDARASMDNVSVVKEALAQLGLCSSVVRPPITTVAPDTSEHIEVFLQSIDSAGYLN